MGFHRPCAEITFTLNAYGVTAFLTVLPVFLATFLVPYATFFVPTTVPLPTFLPACPMWTPKCLPPRTTRQCFTLLPRLLPALPVSLPASFICPPAVGLPLWVSFCASAKGAATVNVSNAIVAIAVCINFFIVYFS